MTAYKILIAEDEGLIAMDIASRLEALGHTVAATASTAAEAIEWAGGADVVLMDIRLDGPVDGIDAAIRIRAQHHVPVIFLTAHADRSTLERAKLAGPYGFLVKPVASASLQTTIEIALYKHHMERQLEESEAWLRATLSSAADAVVSTDPEGVIRTLNPAAERLFESRPATVSELIPGDPVALAILKDGPVAIETRLGDRILEGCATPVKSAQAVIGAVITMRDVSARRREQLRLQQMEKAEITARLAAGVANDYANLIAIIRNQSEQLLHQFADYSPVRQALEEIQQAAAAAGQITRRLAEVGATEPGHPEILSLHGILRRMTRLMQSVAGEAVTVTIRPGASAGKIHADAAQVEDLLMRLVMHAVKAMPTGGQLAIETADADDHVSLSVTHDGAPADPGTSDVVTSDVALARYVAAEDAHRLEAFFPRWSEPAPAGEVTPTLLLIEPREHIRGRLHNFFEANGYNLLEADDDDQARTLLELQEVDLVIAGSSETAGALLESVPVLAVTPPYTQQALLEQVRAAILLPPDTNPPHISKDALTFSVSTQ
jgi:CheY-like chemotaxis protein